MTPGLNSIEIRFGRLLPDASDLRDAVRIHAVRLSARDDGTCVLKVVDIVEWDGADHSRLYDEATSMLGEELAAENMISRAMAGGLQLEWSFVLPMSSTLRRSFFVRRTLRALDRSATWQLALSLASGELGVEQEGDDAIGGSFDFEL